MRATRKTTIAPKAPPKRKAEACVDEGRKSDAAQLHGPFPSTPKRMRGKRSKTKRRTHTGPVDSSNEAGEDDAEMEDLPAKSPTIVKPEPLASDLELHEDPGQAPQENLQLGDLIDPDLISDNTGGLVPDNTALGTTEISHNAVVMNKDSPSGPLVNVIQPTPQSSPAKPPARSNGFLYVPHPDTRASSETPSTASSVSEATIEKAHRYASRGVWKSCLNVVAELQSRAIESINVQMLFEVTVLAAYIKRKEIPPRTIRTQDHWEYVGHAAEELVRSGKDRQDVAPAVLEMLDGVDAASDLLDQWIEY